MTTPIIVKGSRGFTFEFKLAKDGKSIAFIRYQDGDRGGSPVARFSMFSTQAQIERELMLCGGSNRAVINAATELWRNNLNFSV